MTITENELTHVLLIENNPYYLDVLMAILRRQRELVIIGNASTVGEALTWYHDTCPQIILLDAGLLHRDFREALRQLRAQFPGAGIIALTLLDTGPLWNAILEMGADTVISKSNVLADLLPLIRHTMPNTHPQNRKRMKR